jgi:hypothetical protein
MLSARLAAAERRIEAWRITLGFIVRSFKNAEPRFGHNQFHHPNSPLDPRRITQFSRLARHG